MVKDWSSFFSPTGGYMENGLETGTSGLVLGLAEPFLTSLLWKPLERSEITDIRRKSRSFKAGLTDRITSPTTILGGQERKFHNWSTQHRIGKELREKRVRYDRSASYKIGKVKAKYNSLRAGSRAIGWAYLGLSAASLVESAMTPGLSRSALQSNMSMTGGSMMDTNTAYTQRQRALMAIHESQIGLRDTFGREASSFHR